MKNTKNTVATATPEVVVNGQIIPTPAVVVPEVKMSASRKALMDKALAMNGGIKLAVNRIKADLPINEILNINNFEFSQATIVENGVSKMSRFVVLTCQEDDSEFYFGGSVVTEAFDKFTEEDLFQIREEGIPCKFEKIKSKDKKHNDYTKVTFFPEEV